MPSWGITQKLSRLIGISRAKEISFTGRRIDSKTAERMGIVNEVFKSDELLNKCEELAMMISKNKKELIVNLKKEIDDGFDLNFKDGMDLEKFNAKIYYKNMKLDNFNDLKNFKSKL
jgi:enoyl-CoA hydratase